MIRLEDVRRSLAGISAIPVTPFDANGDVEVGKLADIVRRAAEGADVVVAGGNTS